MMALTLSESVERVQEDAETMEAQIFEWRRCGFVDAAALLERRAAAYRCVLAELAGLRAQVESEQAGAMELRRRFGANPTETFPGFVERIAAELEQTTAQLAKEREAYATMSAAVIDATGLPVPAGGWTALEAVAALREVVAHWRRNADEIGVADGHALVLGWENLKTRAEEAEARAAKAEARVAVLEHACSSQNYEVCQTLGKALGYFWFKDDQKNFPGATEANGVCVGDHVAETIASEAARRITELEAQVTKEREAYAGLSAAVIAATGLHVPVSGWTATEAVAALRREAEARIAGLPTIEQVSGCLRAEQIPDRDPVEAEARRRE